MEFKDLRVAYITGLNKSVFKAGGGGGGGGGAQQIVLGRGNTSREPKSRGDKWPGG